jgi:general secretion pathway protein J
MSRNSELGSPPARGRPPYASRAVGFTLVELLVALAIFAIMSGFAYRALNSMLESREALAKESRKWRDVSLFVGRVERDVAAVLPRIATGAGELKLAPLSSSIDSTAPGLAVTRSGNMLAGNVSAAPQRVAYRLREGRVERLAWVSVDAAPRDEPQPTPVLADVGSLAFRFMDPKTSEWRPDWGLPGNAAAALPAAVEMTLVLASGERIVRLFDLPRAAQ